MQPWSLTTLREKLKRENVHSLPKIQKVVVSMGVGEAIQDRKILDELMAICERYGVPIVEDAAESLGSYYKGQPSGSFGKFGIFSFNGNKCPG